jgi:signal transduction histidine kinase
MGKGRLANLGWAIGCGSLVAVGAFVIVRADIADRRAQFQADARIAHRLLSQRAAQHDAILATLSLLAPAVDARQQPEAGLPALYPQVLTVLRRTGPQPWADTELQDAEHRSRATGHAVLGPVDTKVGQYTLVRAGELDSFALRIDVARMVPWQEWPVQQEGAVRVALVYAGHTLVLQPGQSVATQPLGLTEGFVFTKRLAPNSQPFELQLRRATGPTDWPWHRLLTWTLLAVALVTGLASWHKARTSSRRAMELLRFGQITRLNTLGELAAGMAHELNQPLTAVVANAAAARRLLADDPPALDTVRHAVGQIEAQGRRVADVVTRLRRQVETPESAAQFRDVDLLATVRHVSDLLVPELRRHRVTVSIRGPSVRVLADPVALQQIVHNLLNNALQALADRSTPEPTVTVRLHAEQGQGILTISDNGPGIDPDDLARVFEPFYSTRPGGLGLGLSLCAALTQSMHGSLQASNADAGGAQFRLALPLAGTHP